MSDKASDKTKAKLNKTEQNVYDLFYQYLVINGDINNQQAQDLINRSAATVRRYLTKFVTLGLLETEGERKTRRYQLLKK